ncbi:MULTISPECIES: Lrp/AsnC family transcriptional regulator [unclassified Nonomuraea]|uniref:Lrp/AsnC family transcriptional regulator n=1 Tax=unclassified Nonomuraea TaxID=2593643 RepID=UPI0033CCDD33
MEESGSLEAIDLALAHALQLDGRAPFNRIGEVLGVSEHTVARRYRRLRGQGLLRVVGVLDATLYGHTSWAVRLVCTPDAAGPVAEALARRDDTVWVRLMSGGTEIVCGVHAAAEDGDELLLKKLPRTPRVVAMTAHATLHMYAGWRSRVAVLSEAQAARLRHVPREPVPAASGGPTAVSLGEQDRAVLRVLAQDGRAGYGDLAAAGRCSQSTVRRRVEQLRAAGALRFDVEIPSRALGHRAEAWLWMKVRPARLARSGPRWRRIRRWTWPRPSPGRATSWPV